MSGETKWGMSPAPAPSATSSAFAAEARRFSAACLRYSQLAQPAHAKAASSRRTIDRTMELRFTEMRPLVFIVRKVRCDRWAHATWRHWNDKAAIPASCCGVGLGHLPGSLERVFVAGVIYHQKPMTS